MHPGVKRKRMARVLVAIDQSGSVGNDSLELLFGELAGLAKRVDFDVVHFDTAVDEKSLTTWRRGQRIAPHRTRCGGTDFNAPTEFANKHKGQYDMLVVLTDGEAPEPKPCLIRRAWVLVPGTSMYYDTNETVIKMKAEVKKNAA
jgi:predicted metal-dependent peptidase